VTVTSKHSNNNSKKQARVYIISYHTRTNK
jgi:hypothetical protein